MISSFRARSALRAVKVLYRIFEEHDLDSSPGWHERRRTRTADLREVITALDHKNRASDYVLSRMIESVVARDNRINLVRDDRELLLWLAERTTDQDLYYKAYDLVFPALDRR